MTQILNLVRGLEINYRVQLIYSIKTDQSSVVAEILEYNGTTPGTEITNLFTSPYYGGQPNGQPEDNLPIGNYKFKFTATDPRLSDIQNDDAWQAEWLDEFTTEDNITVEIVATGPTFDEINATLSATFEVDNRSWVDVFDPWINTIKVTDFNGTELIGFCWGI